MVRMLLSPVEHREATADKPAVAGHTQLAGKPRRRTREVLNTNASRSLLPALPSMTSVTIKAHRSPKAASIPRNPPALRRTLG